MMHTRPMPNGPLRIALLSPKGPLYRHRTGIFRKDLRAAPLTLTTLASLVPEDVSARVTIYDEGIRDLPADLEADLVGMTVITGSAVRAYELSARFRERGIPVVLGGPHVTLMPDEAEANADAIVTGYAEQTWPELLRDFVRGEMKRRYVMDPKFSFAEMPRIPFPHRHLMDRSGYKTLNTFEATRGCIHKCEFCVVPSAWGTRPFQKPIGHVIADIKQTGARKLLFYDLNLLADFGYARELFTALVPLKVRWFGLSTVLLAKDPALMELAAKSGCSGLLIGFETVSKTGLQSFNKKFANPAEYGEIIRAFHALGIALNGTFVFGNDSDTEAAFDEVRDFVLEHRIDLPRFSIMTPFPGTPLFKRLDADGRILTRDWSRYDGQHVVFRPAKMSADALQVGHERIWREVYSWRSMFRRIKPRVGDFPIVAAANVAYRFYAHNLSRFYTCTGGLA